MKKFLTSLLLMCTTFFITLLLLVMIIQHMYHQAQAHHTLAYNGAVVQFLLLNIIIAAGFDIMGRFYNEMKKIVHQKASKIHDKKMELKQKKQVDLTPYGINKEKLIFEIFQIYKKIQIAWMDFDYETLKKYTTNELYNMYVSQLNTLKVKNQKNIMENIRFYSGDIIDYKIDEKGLETVFVRLIVNCQDYLIDQTSQKVVRGNKIDTMNYTYKLTLIRKEETESKQCPNCGAALESNMTSQCPYCNSVIIHKEFNWILSKKEMIHQTRA